MFITLIANDGGRFELSRDAAMLSATVKAQQEEVCSDEVHLKNVTSELLVLIVEWCQHHVDNPVPAVNAEDQYSTDNIDEWDLCFLSKFMKNNMIIFAMINATNWLDIKDLNDLCCKGVAIQLKEIEKNPENLEQRIEECFALPADHPARY